MANQRVKVIIFIAFMIMILMRLVWLQTRNFAAIPDRYGNYSGEISENLDLCSKSQESQKRLWPDPPLWFYLAEKSCDDGVLHPSRWIAQNRAWLIATVFFAVMLTRLLYPSWVVAAGVAVMLLSRGSFLTTIGHLDTLSVALAVLTCWLTLYALCLRTRARLAIWSVCLLTVGSMLVHPILVPLPILLLSLINTASKRQAQEKLPDTRVPFRRKLNTLVTEVFQLRTAVEEEGKRRPWRSTLVVMSTSVSLWLWWCFYGSGPNLVPDFERVDDHRSWLQIQTDPFDYHLASSLLVALLGAFWQRKVKKPALKVSVRIVFCWLVLATLSSWVLDRIIWSDTTAVVEMFPVIYWSESTLLVFGVIVFFNLLRPKA